jgi:hypothetical protein
VLTSTGPDVTGISSDVPAGCQVDLAAFFSRHGSRYPDNGAYNEWIDLYKRIQAAGPFNVTDKKLDFLKTWKPVLSHPERQIAQISPTGYKELHDMGSTWRLRYPDLYEYNTPFTMWANWYKSSPRVRDSARLFAQGFVGPNSTDLTTIYALNSSDPASWMNSLATSDLCKAYNDEGGSPYKDEWDAIYLPPIRSRLNAKIQGSFIFTQGDVSIIPYLCGFETQITGRRSPFCELFTENEVLQYEYAQDLRYWYGNGLGSDIEKHQMLPVVEMVAQRFVDGPNATYKTGNVTFVPPRLWQRSRMTAKLTRSSRRLVYSMTNLNSLATRQCRTESSERVVLFLCEVRSPLSVCRAQPGPRTQRVVIPRTRAVRRTCAFD